MKLASVANSYAKAILEIGIETNQVDVFAEELEQILSTLQKDKQGWEFFVSPRVPKRAKLDVMRKSFDKKINPNLLNALSVIINHDRIYFLPEIYKAYNFLNDERKGVLRAEVFSAVKLKEPQLKEIQSWVLSTFKGKECVLKETIKPELIGGFVIKYGDVVVDCSIKRKIESLTQYVLDDLNTLLSKEKVKAYYEN